MLRRDIFQQEPKRGNVPLPVGQSVNRTILNILTSHPERLTKSAVCSDNTKMLIEEEKGIPDRIHDPLGERVSSLTFASGPMSEVMCFSSLSGSLSPPPSFFIHFQKWLWL